jgi:transcriptional regulator with XRE-family HTH domain
MEAEMPVDDAAINAPTDFGGLVRYYRTGKGLTQEQVGLGAGVSTGYVGLIEQKQRGAKASRDITLRFAQALDLPPRDTERLFRAAGHLAEGESLYNDNTQNRVVDAIEADPTLPDSSKQLLLNVYLTLSRAGMRR